MTAVQFPLRNKSRLTITNRVFLRARVFRALLLLSAVCVVPDVLAHRLNLTTSDIVWQAEERALEITHSLHLDDALTLLARLGNPGGTLDLKGSARLMNYLNKRFHLVTAKQRLTLEPYGAHIDGGVLYMYQRVITANLPLALEVTNTILHDVITDAQNQVNWRVGDTVRSHSTGPDQPVAWLALQPPTRGSSEK